MEDAVEWQNRRLEPMYPVVFFDALRVKIRDEGSVKNKAVYLALGIQRDGTKDVLGLWIQQTEGAKFWLAVMNELFGIDARARAQNLGVTERDQLGQQKARPILESIKSQIETAKGQTLPKSALAKACNYTLTFWNRLTRFLDHSILELSTNVAENAIRPVTFEFEFFRLPR
jgi:hypothetical protein